MGLADITFVSPFILPQAIHPFADVSLTSKRRTIYALSWERVFSLIGNNCGSSDKCIGNQQINEIYKHLQRRFSSSLYIHIR